MKLKLNKLKYSMYTNPPKLCVMPFDAKIIIKENNYFLLCIFYKCANLQSVHCL